MTLHVGGPARIYIEPTNFCNLDCRTCMRNVWDEPHGFMSESTFDLVLSGFDHLESKPLLFFGGYGEPLAHPNILTMIRMAKDLGCRVELITNGTLLNCETAEKLTDLCLDRLWVSLDGATPKSYSDIRLGDELNGVLDNLFGLVRNRTISKREFPKLGIAFVAMKRNIADLPAVIAIGKTLGADLFSISNVMPHTEELQREILYQKSLYYNDQSPAIAVDGIQFPRMDLNTETLLPLSKFLGEQIHEKAKFPKIPVGANTCPFIEKKSLSIRWDGMVSPCLPLMHTHQNYLDDTRRISHSYSYGDVNLNGLGQIWNDPAYVQFRNRLMDFDFSPCTFCNSCENAESNLEDCFGNIQPACGGCLWAQGFIQCP